jgi:hypothetical protein
MKHVSNKLAQMETLLAHEKVAKVVLFGEPEITQLGVKRNTSGRGMSVGEAHLLEEGAVSRI